DKVLRGDTRERGTMVAPKQDRPQKVLLNFDDERRVTHWFLLSLSRRKEAHPCLESAASDVLRKATSARPRRARTSPAKYFDASISGRNREDPTSRTERTARTFDNWGRFREYGRSGAYYRPHQETPT